MHPIHEDRGIAEHGMIIVRPWYEHGTSMVRAWYDQESLTLDQVAFRSCRGLATHTTLVPHSIAARRSLVDYS